MVIEARCARSASPLISIVIPTYNRREKLVRLVSSILSSDYPLNRVRIIIVDDGSTDGTLEAMKKKFPTTNLKIIRNDNEKLTSQCRNIGLSHAEGKYVFFIDDDAVIDHNTLSYLVRFMEDHKDVGVAGPIVLYLEKPNIVWCAGVNIDLWTTWGTFIERDRLYVQRSVPINCDAIPTAFMIKVSLARRIGFNDKLFPIQYEELDFCIRVNRMGYKVVVAPWIKVWHDVSRANFLRTPLRTYFETRNLIVAHTLWSHNQAQMMTSRISAIVMALSHLIISVRYSRNHRATLSAIFSGLRDGLAISQSLTKRY